MFKPLLAGLLALMATPLFAQATGPEGLAEPKPLPEPKVVEAPAPPMVASNVLNLSLSTGGTVSILLRPDKAPLSVARIKELTNRHFYDGLTFHRVIPGFMAQSGDPKGDGSGGSDLPDVKAEFNDLPHVRGAMAMARAADEDSANSQFYIMLAPNLTLDGRYTVIGRVFQGMHYVDQIAPGEPPPVPSRILKAWIGPAPADPALSPQEMAQLQAALPQPPASASPLANAPTTLDSGAIGGSTQAPAPAPRKKR